eukprot:2784271-Pleurochrysis_carterae.AAC.2
MSLCEASGAERPWSKGSAARIHAIITACTVIVSTAAGHAFSKMVPFHCCHAIERFAANCGMIGIQPYVLVAMSITRSISESSGVSGTSSVSGPYARRHAYTRMSMRKAMLEAMRGCAGHGFATAGDTISSDRCAYRDLSLALFVRFQDFLTTASSGCEHGEVHARTHICVIAWARLCVQA